MTAASQFIVGNSGSGVLNISGSAVVTMANPTSGDQWFSIGSGAGSTGEINMSGGKLLVNDLAVGNAGTGTLNLSGGEIICSNWYLPAFGNGTGKTIQTGGSISTPWFITAWSGANGTGVHEMYDGTLTVGGNNSTSHNGRTGTGYINMYGGSASFVNLMAGEKGGTGIFNFSGGEMAISGYLALNTANSKINFIGGTKGFGKLSIGGNLTNAAPVNVSFADGLMFLDGYDLDNGLTIMNVAGTGIPTINSSSSLFAADWVNQSVKITVDNRAFQGALSAVCDKLTIDNSDSGWANLTNLTGNDPFVISMTFDNISNITDFLAAFNDDLKVGEQQVWTASEGALENQVVIEGLTPSLAGSGAFAWDFTSADYQGALLTGLNSQQVPDPSTWALLILGAAGLGWLRRKPNASITARD